MENNVLEMRNISKEFFGVRVLHNIDFSVRYGEIHGLLGENGAGKSTLTKILCGALTQEEGAVFLQGEQVRYTNPSEAHKAGIGMVFQELNLLPHLSVAENIYISDIGEHSFKRIHWKSMEENAARKLKSLGVHIDVRERLGNLSIAQQQIVAIARALASECKILVLDEPTSALSQRDIDTLFSIMKRLKENHIAIIFISHKLNEIMEITDRITVLNNGRKVAERETEGISEEELSALIIGKTIENKYPKVVYETSDEILRLENVSVKNKLENISFELRKGEILGIVGLLGAGKTEIANTIFGVYGNNPHVVTGKVYLNGEELTLESPNKSVHSRIGYVTENRGDEGLLLAHSIRDNVTLPALKLFKKGLFINKEQEKSAVGSLINKLQIKCQSQNQQVRNLSGGNQQKVVISKWLITQSQLIIFDEPTRGIDVGAKVEIYNLMNDLVKQGVGVILLSSEVPEVYGMADRIVVLKDGRIVNEFKKKEISEHELQTLVM